MFVVPAVSAPPTAVTAAQDNEYKRGLEEDRRRQEEQMEEQRIRV